MTTKPRPLSKKEQAWIIARKRHHLTPMHVQMARELGLNPRKFGKLDNHKQEPWKQPLPEFIERIYAKRFGKARPETVQSIEARARALGKKAAARSERKRLQAEADAPASAASAPRAPTVAAPAPEPADSPAAPPTRPFDDVPF